MDLYSGDELYTYGYGYGYGFLGDFGVLENVLKEIDDKDNDDTNKNDLSDDSCPREINETSETIVGKGMKVGSKSTNDDGDVVVTIKARGTVSTKGVVDGNQIQWKTHANRQSPSASQVPRPARLQDTDVSEMLSAGTQKSLQKRKVTGAAPSPKYEERNTAETLKNGGLGSGQVNTNEKKLTTQGAQDQENTRKGGTKQGFRPSVNVECQALPTQNVLLGETPKNQKKVEERCALNTIPAFLNGSNRACNTPSQAVQTLEGNGEINVISVNGAARKTELASHPRRQEVRGLGELKNNKSTVANHVISLNGRAEANVPATRTIQKQLNEKYSHGDLLPLVRGKDGNGPMGANGTRPCSSAPNYCNKGVSPSETEKKSNGKTLKAVDGNSTEREQDSLSADAEGASVETVPQAQRRAPPEKQRGMLETWAATLLLMPPKHHQTHAAVADARLSKRVSSQTVILESTGEQMQLDYSRHNVYNQLVFLDRPPQLDYPSEMPITMKKIARRRRARSPRSFYGPKGATLGVNWFQSALNDARRVESPDLESLEAEESAAKKAEKEARC